MNPTEYNPLSTTFRDHNQGTPAYFILEGKKNRAGVTHADQISIKRSLFGAPGGVDVVTRPMYQPHPSISPDKASASSTWR